MHQKLARKTKLRYNPQSQVSIPPIFIPLRVHSDYSLGESSNKIDKLISHCKKEKIPAIALTDLSNMFGALEFAQKAVKNGIQPISGIVTKVRYQNQQINRSEPGYETTYGSLLLLAKNRIGYQNLLKISSYPYTHNSEGGFVDFGYLSAHMEGLIIFIGDKKCLFREIYFAAGKESVAAAEKLLKIIRSSGAEVYVEIQRYKVFRPDENKISNALIRFAYEHNIPLVATNPAFFLQKSDHDACEALLCISQGSYIYAADRRRVDPEHYLKSYNEMSSLFADIPEAVQNTIIIAQKCSYILTGSAPCLPKFINNKQKRDIDDKTLFSREKLLYHEDDVASNMEQQKNLFDKVEKKNLAPVTKDEDVVEEILDQDTALAEGRMLEEISKAGLKQRIKHITDPEIQKSYFSRLEYELEVIKKMGFSGYFLIVSDFIKWSKSQGIPVGPGRGSGAGSIIAWATEITDVDPIAFNLLFERFLNPDRVSMPDFDIDFCQTRRDEVIQYVRRKYGDSRVAHIITFGKLQARAVLRDVGRVLQMSYSFVDRICKMIPNNPAAPITLEEAIKIDKGLQNMQNSDPDVATLFRIALCLEGVNRHASLHAAGIVISAEDIVETVPLYKPEDSDVLVVQFSMKYAEAAGLMKFDFLGLKTLTMINDSCKIIANEYSEKKIIQLDLHRFDDKKTYNLLAKGQTIGVFQFEGGGMRRAIEKIQPTEINDLIALASLYRPGPMDNIPLYISRKHGLEEVEYIHPSLEETLKETYGIIIYQEQVMQIVQILAGYTLAEADLVRRAMGKKIKEEMEEQREIFVRKAVALGLEEKRASEIFDIVDKFAGYGFNKSHATAYAIIGYHTAYLKANYPHAFFISSINLDIDNSDKVAALCRDAQSQGIKIIPACVNKSYSYCKLTKLVDCNQENNSGSGHDQENTDYAIAFGLVGIKGVGIKIAEDIVNEREKGGKFIDIEDFMARCMPLGLNKKTLDQLAKADAFHGIHPNGAEVLANVEKLLAHFHDKKKSYHHNNSGEFDPKQMNLFSGVDGENSSLIKFSMNPANNWNKLQKLHTEYEALGFYLTEHPLQQYEVNLNAQGITYSKDIENILHRNGDSLSLKIVGVVTASKIRAGKGPRGGKYAFVQIADQYGTIETSIFSEDILNNHSYVIKEGTIVLMQVNARLDDRGMRLIVEKVRLFSDILKSSRRQLQLVINNYEEFWLVKKIIADDSSEKYEDHDKRHDYAVEVVVVISGEGKVIMQSNKKWSLTEKQVGGLESFAGYRDRSAIEFIFS